MWLDLWKLVYRIWQEAYFCHNHKVLPHTINVLQHTFKFHYQSVAVFITGGLFLYEWHLPSGVYIGMCMTVSFVVLNRDLCCLFTKILASCEFCMVHSKVFFTSSPSTDIFHEFLACHLALRHPLIVEFTWYYYLRVTLRKETVFNGGKLRSRLHA